MLLFSDCDVRNIVHLQDICHALSFLPDCPGLELHGSTRENCRRKSLGRLAAIKHTLGHRAEGSGG